MPRKLLDISKIEGLGWSSRICLREGIGPTYEWFLEEGTTREALEREA